MSRHVGASEQGQLQGANASLMGIASLIGPAIFTQSFALFDRRRRGRASAGRAVPARRASCSRRRIAVAGYTMRETKGDKSA